MPDLLTHALVAYIVAQLLSLRYDWLTRAYVTAAMAGAFIPDIAKIRLLVPNEVVSSALGVSFAWGAQKTLGAVVLSVIIGAMVVVPRVRRPTALALGLGAVTHMLSDALLLTATGRSFQLLWPLTRWAPPTPGLYLSTEPWPVLVTSVLALIIWWTIPSRWHCLVQ